MVGGVDGGFIHIYWVMYEVTGSRRRGMRRYGQLCSGAGGEWVLVGRGIQGLVRALLATPYSKSNAGVEPERVQKKTITGTAFYLSCGPVH